MKKITFLLAAFLFISLQALQSQNRTISGKVTSSEDKNGIPGVTVLIKGTTTGTITDIDGKYSLTVTPAAKVLVYSYVGMKTKEIAIGASNIIDVELTPDVMNMEAVVVTAIGVKRTEKSLGYSATQISGEEVTKTQDRSVINSLQGKVAGVNITTASSNPGASTRVFSRGFHSLTGSNGVLYVIDGVPVNNAAIGSTDLNGGTDFGNRVNDINPDDVESMTFLKGSAGTVLYGSRAANGVIVITTKKGKMGVGQPSKKTPTIMFTSTFMAESPLMLPEYQNEFGEGFFGEPDLIENTSWGPKFDGKDRVWGWIVDNSQQIKPYNALESNVKDFWDVGKTWENSISIQNGNENTSYYFSYSNVDADGIFPTGSDSYKRNTLSLRGTANLPNNFSSAVSVNYIKKQSHFVPTGQDQSVYDNVMQTPRDISIVDQEDYNNKFNNLDNFYNGYAANPYYVLNEHGNKFNEDRVFGNVELGYKFCPWLNINWRVGADVANSQLKEWRAITDYVRNDYNDDAGRVIEQTFFTNELNSDLMLNFQKPIGKSFEIRALLGWNINQRNTKSTYAEVIGLTQPFFYNLSNSSSVPSVTEATLLRRLTGVYGSIDLSFKSYLFLTFNARNDWSSTLPEKNNSYFYPGVNLSWVFSDAIPAIQKVIPYGKIRVGWSQTGNDANPYLIYSVFTQANYFDGYRGLDWPMSGVNGFTIGNTIGNPNLQPEISTEIEAGTDLRFFQNRLAIDFTYYFRKTTDLIYPVPLPYSSGYRFQVMNLGEMTNKGVELMVTVTPVKTKNFKWEISYNFAKNYNKLVELNPELEKVDLGGTSRLGFVAVPGMPLGVFEGDAPLYDSDGHIVVDNQGLPVIASEKEIYGDCQYKYTMGAGTSVSWKGLSLSIAFDIRQGGYLYSRTKEMMYFAGTNPETTDNDRQPFIIPNSVTEDPDNPGEYIENTVAISHHNQSLYAYYDQTRGAGGFGKTFLVDKSFVKLRSVVLSYSLPKKWMDKTPFGDIQISLIGRNLLIWTAADNRYIDPELTTFGNDLNAEYGEFSASPSTRSYGVSLKLTF